MHWIVAVAALAMVPAGVVGYWTTPDSSTVRVYACGPAVCAQLVRISSNSPETRDTKNPNAAERTRSLCGLVIGRGFHLIDPSHADGGTLYDPESGKTYRGLMQAHEKELQLRGYVGVPLFGRTEKWHRASQPQNCKP